MLELWPVIVGLLTVSYTLNLWFLVRLVHRFDEFEKEVRQLLNKYGLELVVIQTRHKSEDRYLDDGIDRRRDRGRES